MTRCSIIDELTISPCRGCEHSNLPKDFLPCCDCEKIADLRQIEFNLKTEPGRRINNNKTNYNMDRYIKAKKYWTPYIEKAMPLYKNGMRYECICIKIGLKKHQISSLRRWMLIIYPELKKRRRY